MAGIILLFSMTDDISRRLFFQIGEKLLCPKCDYLANQKGHLVAHYKSVRLYQKFVSRVWLWGLTNKSNRVKHKFFHKDQIYGTRFSE